MTELAGLALLVGVGKYIKSAKKAQLTSNACK